MSEPEVRIGSLESSSRDIAQDVEMGASEDMAAADEALGMLQTITATGANEEGEDGNELEESTQTPKLTFLE